MGDMYRVVRSDELYHYGRKGMKWGMNIFGKKKSFSVRKKKKRKVIVNKLKIILNV